MATSKTSLLVILFFLLVDICFAQITPRQRRLDNRIDRLIIRRYGTDTLKYQIGFDSARERLVIYTPTPLRDTLDSLIKLVASYRISISEQQQTIEKYRSDNSSISKQFEGLNEKYKIVQIKLAKSLDELEKAEGKLETFAKQIQAYKAKRISDSLIIFRLRQQFAAIVDQNRSLADSLEQSNKKFKIADSLLKASTELTLILRTELGDGSRVRDKLQKELNHEREKSENLGHKIKNIYLPSTIGLGCCTFGLAWMLLNFRRRPPEFFPCMIIKVQGEFVYADVFFEKENRTELRRFDASPLLGVLGSLENAIGKIFMLGIVSVPGRKEFIYRKGDSAYKEKFERYYDSYNINN